MSEYRDYENGVADVLAFLADGSATVDRNVRLPTLSGGRWRQVDVLVRGPIFGMANATLIVDCKRRSTPIDVKDVDSFIGMVEDVGADVGMMVTIEGSTEGARDRARMARGVRLEVMSLKELMAWSPIGTVTTTYRVPADRQTDAERVLRNVGFRVAPDARSPAGVGEVVLSVIRHYGTKTPSGELQQGHMTTAEAALRKIGVEPVHVANGIVAGGGTPAHRWLMVAVNGVPSGLKVLASTEKEAGEELDRVAEAKLCGARGALTVVTPEDWPVSRLFGTYE